jgi:predicted site-specific integrase-resolvase
MLDSTNITPGKVKVLNPGCFLSRKEVAQIIGVHPGSIKRYEKRGLLSAVKINERMIRYHRDTVEEFISRYQRPETAA